MKIKLNQVLKDYQGKDIPYQEKGKPDVPLTMQLVLNSALNGIEPVPDGRGGFTSKLLTAEEKGRIFQLSTKLWNAKGEVKFTSNEEVFIKERAEKVGSLNPLTLGRLKQAFEEPEEESEPEKKDSEVKPPETNA